MDSGEEFVKQSNDKEAQRSEKAHFPRKMKKYLKKRGEKLQNSCAHLV